jgi:hypothetical protein
MGNPLRGEATFRAGDREFTLVANVNSFCELEEETGLDLNTLLAELQDRPRLTMLRSVFCAFLQEKHPGTTKREAGDILSDAGDEVASEALGRAIVQAMPPVKRGGAANPPEGSAKRA